MLPPHFPRRRLQRLMNFGALSRGFGTCCLRFKNDVATIPARLTSGWLARLCREGVDPLDRCKRFQITFPSSFSGFVLAQGKFHSEPPSSFTSLDHLVCDGEQPQTFRFVHFVPRADVSGCNKRTRAYAATRSPRRRVRVACRARSVQASWRSQR